MSAAVLDLRPQQGPRMKIRKRHRPAVFGSLTEEIPAQHIGDSSNDPDPPLFEGPVIERTPKPQLREEALSSGPMVARDPMPPPVRREAYARAKAAEEEGLDVPPAWPIYFTAFVVSTLWV